MSIFPSHDLSLNRYYYTFYSYHPNTPNVLNCLVYDQDQNLVETQDISFNGKTMNEMMAFLENSNTNPYAIGKAGTDYRSMDLTFGTVYKKSFQEKQRQKLMTYLNGNYKNVHGTSQSVFTVSASGGKYYVGGYTDPAPNLFAPKEGYYVFDQSDSTNVSHPLVLSTQDGSSNYFSTMFTEGTRGSLNGYTIVDISAGTPDLYYYCTAHSGMGGQLLNFAAAVSYTVSIVYNDTYGQDIYQVAELANYYTDASGIYLSTGSKYAIDLSVLNGTSFNPIIGTTNDVSSSIISDTSIVNQIGDVLYVRPLLSNLYLFDQTVALMAKPLENGYYVKTVQNWTGTSVFTLMEPTESTGIVQRNLSFNAGDVVLFHVGHSSMDNFNLVFGTTVDDSSTVLGNNYVSQNGDIITLDLSSYSGGAVYYFEDSSANMGYVEVSQPIIATNFSNTSQISAGSATGNYNNRTWSQTQYGDFTDGTYNVITSTNQSSNQSNYLAEILLIESSRRSSTPLFAIDEYDVNANGSTANATINTIVNGTNYYGAYAQVTMPYKLVLKEIYVRGPYITSMPDWEFGRKWMPKKVFIFGSNDNGTTFTFLKEDEIPFSSDLTNISSKAVSGITEAYSTIRMVVNSSWVTTHNGTRINHLRFTGDIIDANTTEHTVTVANGVFYIDGVSKPEITFTNGETYVFDQSDPSNAGFPIVFGETPESSSLYTTGVTVVGTPGQAGAYTRIDYTGTTGALYYYNNIIPGMGYAPNTISYYVTVAGTPPKFYLNSARQPISFTANTKYYFYQYDSTNENYPIVFDETADDVVPYFTNGVTTVGTPGQTGAYTILDLSPGFTGPLVYFSSGATYMGYIEPYNVKVVQNWLGNNVFSIQAPNEDFSYNQPNLSFNAGDTFLFDVTDSTMSGYSLVFGTEIDVSSTILGSPYVTDLGTLIGLNLPSNYTGGTVYYFENTNTGMGYVEAPANNLKIYINAQSDSRSGTSLTNLIDSTNNATNVGSVTYDSNIGGRGSYYLPTNASVKLPNVLSVNTFTFSIYYYTTADTLQQYTRILGSSHGATLAGGNLRSINIGTSTRNSGVGDPGIIFYSDSGTIINKPGTTPYNTWHHLCFTHDGITTIVYLNGVNIGSSTNALTMVEPLLLGAHYGGDNTYKNFSGFYFDAVHLYDTVLSASEVTALYNNPYVPTVNTYTLTVSNGAFYIDNGSGAQSKPNVNFTNGEIYIFDQSDPSNTDYPIVFGESKDSTPYYTNGVTVVGTPGQPGAYTRIDYTGSTALFYFSSGNTGMGY